MPAFLFVELFLFVTLRVDVLPTASKRSYKSQELEVLQQGLEVVSGGREEEAEAYQLHVNVTLVKSRANAKRVTRLHYSHDTAATGLNFRAARDVQVSFACNTIDILICQGCGIQSGYLKISEAMRPGEASACRQRKRLASPVSDTNSFE